MLVSRISPAPRPSIRAAHSTASMPVGLRPPCVYTSHFPAIPGTARASIATTVHWLPNRSAACRTNSGSATAAVLIDTLSPPADRSFRMSSSVRTPPPTVRGMNACSAVRRTTSMRMSLRSCEAVMSRKTSSSASSSSYRRAITTGSPASRRFTKLTPLTTRPSFTSRHGMIRLASIAREKGSRPFQAQGVGKRYRAVVHRPPDDDAAHPFALHRPERFHIPQGGHAAGGEHGGGKAFREPADAAEIGPRHHAVAGDVRVDEAGDPALLHLLREVDGDHSRHFHPAAYGHPSFLGVDRRGHLAGIRLRDPQDLLGVAHDGGTQDDPRNPRAEVPGVDVEVPHPSAHLYRDVDGGHD